MKKFLQFVVLAALCPFASLSGQTIHKPPTTILTGIVTGAIDHTPLQGATVTLKPNGSTTLTDKDGQFTFSNASLEGTLTVSYIGYKSASIHYTARTPRPFMIALTQDNNALEAVHIVSNGYQDVPQERATGSFTPISNQLLNRRVSTGILDKLDGITSGLIFNNNGNYQYGQGSIEIRGRSTLFSNAEPLIVVDNFPYDGDINNINPNDVENITVLKDAAAASAWGSRSGNGVIVITTKKGRLNAAPTINFNATTTIGEKPNLYYTPQLTSAQYIEVEQFLFNQGAYDNAISSGYAALSPAVTIFQKTKSGAISAADSLQQISALKGYDSRKQLLKYYYRNSLNQQYQASISGGGAAQKYFVSAGYDKNLNSYVNSSYERVTLNANNTYYFLKNKLELYTNIQYTGSTTKTGPVMSSTPYPYDQLADANGNALALANTLSLDYASTSGSSQLLNWLYKPLDELRNGYSSTVSSQTDYRINLSLSYKIISGLRASALYTFEKGLTNVNNLNELQSYYTRNLINTYAQIDATTGAATYAIPVGAILNTATTILKSQNGRFQLNYDHSWGKHLVSAIAGTEIKDYNTFSNSYGLYGYNPETASNQNQAINFSAYYPYSYGYNTGQIPTNATSSGTTDRFFSVYSNASYTYDGKYILSGSARKDESNLFGVSANQKGVPLWSVGLAWVINQEKFYKVSWLPQLKFRATYGYTGNVNTSISAYLTTIHTAGLTQTYNAYFTSILNAPNPSLRWERNRNMNLGLDFGFKGSRISGSVDYWRKTGLDLIGSSPIAPQTGITLYTGNSANTLTTGVDLQLNTVNLNGKLKWFTTVLYNYSQNKVTHYEVSNGTNLNVVSANYTNPLTGYPYYALFAFRYAGLNGSGDPQGYLNGKISTDYSSMMNATNRGELVYKGSATPTSFGSLRNTFEYQDFDLSLNITYKLGYYFRRSSLNNAVLYSGAVNSYQMADYDKRWQKAGDERYTNVPALLYPDDLERDNLYTYSDVLVVNASHIRLQDFRLGYTFAHSRLPFKSLNVFTYVNNIGILWRANKYGIDPDYPTGIPNPRTYSLGLKASL